MNGADLIGWAIYGWATAGEWLLLPVLLTGVWALYRLAIRRHRRGDAIRALTHAQQAQLITEAHARDTAALNPDTHPGTNQAALNECRAIWNTEPRKEKQ